MRWYVAVALTATLAFAGCTSSHSSAPSTPAASSAPATAAAASSIASSAAAANPWAGCDSASPQQTLTVAMSGDDPTLDPMFSNNQISNEINYNVEDQFFKYGTKPGPNGIPIYDVSNITGWSVQSWQWSPDGKSITLNLRQGSLFHHTSNPVTASDFIYWFNRAKGTNAGGEFNLSIGRVTSWSQTGLYQIQVDFSVPFSPFFYYLFRDQSQAPLDSKVIQAQATTGDQWATKFVAGQDLGSGAYYVEKWDRGVEMDLCANPVYWNSQPYFKRVVLKIVPNESDRVLLLKQGAVDIAETLSIDSLNSLRGTSGVNVLSEPTRDQVDLGFNNQMAPFTNKSVRQALAYATPYQEIVQSIYNGQAQITKGPIPVGGLYFNGSYDPYSFDLAKAKQLLTQAGYGNGLNFTVSLQSGDATLEKLAVLLQTTFKQIGVNMAIQEQTPAVFAQGQAAHTQQAWIRDLLWYVDDPAYVAQGFFKSGGCCDWTNYNNPAINQLADQMGSLQNTGPDQATKTQLANQYQQIIDEDVPLIYLTQTNFQLAMRSDIAGYVQGPDNILWYYPLTRK